MSATADADLFANYFAAAAPPGPVAPPPTTLFIPGFTHPVEDLFLEDALEATGFLVGKASRWARRDGGKEGGKEGKGKGKEAAAGGATKELEGYSRETAASLSNIDEALVNVDLIEALVAHVAPGEAAAGGAVLVFCPGADDIGRVVRALSASGRLAAAVPGGVRALPLHGGLPPAAQSRVFERPPRGVLKVVVATNVAETSITIDDVTVVIDTGRAKELRHDPVQGLARLAEGWVSRASAQQRRGRAGRVRPGVCFRLFSRRTWAKMAVDTAPEVARAPLEALVMDVKSILGPGADAAAALDTMLTPPTAAAAGGAVAALRRVGALDATPAAALTPLGRHLARMPCDARLGKMLVFGAMLRCLDPILTCAAAASHGRPAFFSPPDARAEADAARRRLLEACGVADTKSDHLATVAAYNAWRAALAHGGRAAAGRVAEAHFISGQAMDAVHAARRQLAEILADLGFVPPAYPAAAAGADYSPGSAPGPGRAAAPPSAAAARFAAPGGPDEFAGHARVVKAALCAGLYPRLLRADHPAPRFRAGAGGAVEIETDASGVRFFDRERGRVFVHPSSVNFRAGKFESGWLAYGELVATTKPFARETSMVPVYAVLLFGGALEVAAAKGLVRVDGWAAFRAPGRIAVLVRGLRAEVAALLERKVADPGLDLGGSRVVEAMHHLLANDGF
jgi:ATP-dependent RNA helicase DHX57